MDNFEELYSKLNINQKKAVDSIDGPVLVLAGPGTGKTQVLTLRIANILKLTDSNPENILALTFTENAAQNMRERLAKIIGNSAYKVKISTFHSFCNDIILNFPEKFAFTGEISAIDEIARYNIFSQFIGELDSHAYDEFSSIQQLALSDGDQQKILLRPFGAKDLYLKDIIKSIDNLKQESISPDKFSKLISQEIEILSNEVEINPKTKKRFAKWSEHLKLICKNIELLSIYKKYLEYSVKQNFYDFGDMINFVREKLSTDDELLAYCQENFQYVLVDEYQDTNNAQNEVVKQILSWDENPNIFAVGDDDQSIFRFQGANLENILNFTVEYPNTKILTLNENYRSNQQILDIAAQIISNNQNRLVNKIPDISKNLHANVAKKNRQEISVTNLQNGEEEFEYLASKIKNLLENKTEPSEIAIIYRKHKDGNQIYEYLKKSGIEVNIVHSNNLFETQIFQDFLTLLKVVIDPTDNQFLAQLIRQDVWAFDEVDIYKIFRYYNSHSRNSDLALFDLLVDLEKLNNEVDSSPSTNMQITSFVSQILRWHNESANWDAKFLVEKIIIDLSLPQKYLSDIHSLSAIRSIIMLSKRNSDFTKIRTISQFVSELTSAISNQIAIKVPEIKSEGLDKVSMLSAHASKGLEFEHVFLSKVSEKVWSNSREINKLKIINLFNSDNAKNLDEGLQKSEEERRLFFVALTRAKNNIYISYANEYFENSAYKSYFPSQFIAEIENENISKFDSTSFEFDQAKILSLGMSKKNELKISDRAKEFFAKDILNFKLSATALNLYLSDTKLFFDRYILKLPEVKNKHLAIGSAIHSSLQFFYQKIQRNEAANLSFLFQIFENSMLKEFSGHKDFAESMQVGKDLIKNWYEKQNENFVKPIATEYSFFAHSVFLDNTQLVGKIDKIELLSKEKNSVKIIDYKTGSPKSLNTIVKPIDGGQESDYYRQLVFYKLLCELDRNFKYKPEIFEFEFIKLEKGNLKKVQVEIPDDDVEKLKQIIVEVMGKIRRFEF